MKKLIISFVLVLFLCFCGYVGKDVFMVDLRSLSYYLLGLL